MLEQELKDIWKNSSKEEKIKFEMSRLLIELKNQVNHMEKSIRSRDTIEIVLALLMIPVFGYLTYEIPFILTKIGSASLMILLIHMIFRIKNTKKYKVDIDTALSFKEQLENQKLYFLQEVRLIDTMIYWNLLPFFAALAVYVLGLGDPVEYNWVNDVAQIILPITLISKIAYLTCVVVVYAVIFWLNKRTIRKTYNPLISEIEKVQNQLQIE